jgi:hypothetical protein
VVHAALTALACAVAGTTALAATTATLATTSIITASGTNTAAATVHVKPLFKRVDDDSASSAPHSTSYHQLLPQQVLACSALEDNHGSIQTLQQRGVGRVWSLR